MNTVCAVMLLLSTDLVHPSLVIPTPAHHFTHGKFTILLSLALGVEFLFYFNDKFINLHFHVHCVQFFSYL